MAASNGLRSATLAAAGLRGAAEAFEGEGFLKAFSGGAVDRWAIPTPLGAPFAIVEPGLERKRYPCCYLLHKTVEATIALANEHALDLDQLRSAEVRMPPGGTKPLIHPRPTNGLEARFSAPYAVLASIADRRMDLGVLTDATVTRSEIQSRLDRVKTVEESGASTKGSEVDRAPVTVILDLNDGRRLTRTVVASPGSAEDPMTSAQLRAKWLDCLKQAAPGVRADESETLFNRGTSIGEGAAIGEWLQSVQCATSETHGARAA
jgi:2-methylcitrate dehydratase PrpD